MSALSTILGECGVLQRELQKDFNDLTYLTILVKPKSRH
jgi:hypothetical protein